MGNFVHLHLHTEYSLLDGATRIDRLFKRCKELGQDAVAITDHGVMYGVIDFYKAAKKAGIKPIIGCEFYVVNDHKQKVMREHRDHLVLLAKNEAGYKSLMKLDSIAFVDGFYTKPRIDLELLRKYHDGLICLTGCLAGHIPQALLKGEEGEADKYLKELKGIFGDDLYVEIQDHGLRDQKFVLNKLIDLARQNDVKLVATNDVHYLNKEDAAMQDMLLRIQTASKISDVLEFGFETDEFYLKSEEEMRDLFGFVEESITNTVEIAEKCNLEIKFHQPLIPNYVPENGMTCNEFFRDIMEKGLKRRYKEITPEIRERAEYEFNIISSMGYVDYYLIVWDFINYAKTKGIPVGYGRGSGVGSIIAYAIGITNVDPLRFSLLFERFLNPERNTMPDFDIDFCCDRRGEVIDYVTEKYGKDNVCQIVTFGKMAAKNAVRDVARVYEVPIPDVLKVTKLIPSNPALKVTLDKIFDKDHKGKDGKNDHIEIPELTEIYENDPQMRKVIDMARKVEGMPRNTGMHAAGVVICGKKLDDWIPLQRNGPNVTTQFAKDTVEELGFLKMDFLGLITLTDLKKATDYVEENYDILVDFDEIPDDDPEVYKMIGEGKTACVFQLEQGGMTKFMTNLKPSNLEDITAGISLYRPGPMQFCDVYVKGKHNPDKVEYLTPLLEDILGVTYGVFIYQEQVMQIVQKLAGYTLGQADIIRRAMSKKKKDVMDIHRKLFIEGGEEPDKHKIIPGAASKGVPKEAAGKLFDQMEEFANYAFNKSHAAAYATLTYQTAYFMRYYPCEFFCAVLNNRITDIKEVTKYTTFARERGIEILPPDINKSQAYFRAHKEIIDGKEIDTIRFGLAGIKNVGEGVVKEIIAERDRKGAFKDLGDFFDRCADKINKKMMECLINGGAFDCFGHERTQLLLIYEKYLSMYVEDKKNQANGQMSLFGDVFEDTGIEIVYPDFQKEDDITVLGREKDVLGIYVSGHPLNTYKEKMEGYSFNTSMAYIEEKSEDEEDFSVEEKPSLEGEKVVMGGILKGLRKVITKEQKTMKYGQIEDLFGSIDVVFFPKVYERSKDLVEDDMVVEVKGTLVLKSDTQYQLNAENVKPLGDIKKQTEIEIKPQRLFLKIETEDILNRVQDILIEYEGDVEVAVKFKDAWLKLPYKVDVTQGLFAELETLLKTEDVVCK